MTRTVNVTLSGVAEHGDLQAQVILRTVRPRGIDYCEATVLIDVGGHQMRRRTLELTRTAALRSVACWMFEKFGPAIARVGREVVHDHRTTVVKDET